MRKGFCACLSHRVLLGPRDQPADPAHSLGLLCMPSEQQCRRPADNGDEFTPPHSITSSAMPRTVAGTVRPSALAVLRLMINEYFVGYWTGRSAGLAPLRMRSI